MAIEIRPPAVTTQAEFPFSGDRKTQAVPFRLSSITYAYLSPQGPRRRKGVDQGGNVVYSNLHSPSCPTLHPLLAPKLLDCCVTSLLLALVPLQYHSHYDTLSLSLGPSGSCIPFPCYAVCCRPRKTSPCSAPSSKDLQLERIPTGQHAEIGH